MLPIKYSDSVINKFPEIYDYTKTNLITSVVSYVIDSKYRKAVEMSKWLKEQGFNHTEDLIRIADEIKNSVNPDVQAWHVMRYVQELLTYKSDKDNWNTDEKWSDVKETAKTMSGDCEDGSVLIYLLCRMKGIPANRLLIWCGDLTVGGHCCLFYKPKNYPLSFVNLDWCYLPSKLDMLLRNKVIFKDKEIHEFSESKEVVSVYKKTWFMFNEDVSYNSFKMRCIK